MIATNFGKPMSKYLSIILSICLVMSCAKKADNIETQPKTNSTTAIEVSKDLVEKVSMTIKKPFKKLPIVKIDINKINFEFDSYQLSSQAKKDLSKAAKSLREDKRSSIVIAGHCDSRGTKDYNLILGEKRAIAVKNFLIDENISKSRIQTISYGEERPIKADNDEKAYKENRRCDLTIK
jgi:peptidoglycan-associated lipoprotein